MKKIVLSLGGSILVPALESHTIPEYAEVLKQMARRGQVFVVVGGGGEARRYIGVARSLGINEAASDEIGIMITRINASLLCYALGNAAYPSIATSYQQAREYGESGKIVVMGGVTPGQTTDAVSAVLAESVGADLIINGTSVDGIYSADPKTDRTARRYERMTPQELLGIISGARLDAGSNTVIDIVAAKVVERSGIPLLVIDGRKPENLTAAVCEGTFTGTIVSDGKCTPLPL
ncbi:MAG: UMP kinase [Methanofollis liminatans]|jgi:uridylate kinase|uniref:Uridylate kinase n=1 Tax=Methanofollis liminatans DSM 4140 TaxID=28892 RepID=J1ARM1_9EURY|nr:UMP kinase [Methanofollis liminatans]EJG07663.1 uridylate kinase [Methanofollis liminatans DSM 4140]MDD3111226.1 UMP kinase [Methanofollis liminatans]